MDRRGFLRAGALSVLGATVPLGLVEPAEPKGESLWDYDFKAAGVTGPAAVILVKVNGTKSIGFFDNYYLSKSSCLPRTVQKKMLDWRETLARQNDCSEEQIKFAIQTAESEFRRVDWDRGLLLEVNNWEEYLK